MSSRLVFTIACVVALSGVGCLFSPDEKPDPPAPNPPQELLPPTSPENVINNLEVSYLRKNIDYYDAVIHDEFVFKPNAIDNVGFTELNKTQDRLSTLNMFDQVEDIDIGLTFGSVQASDLPPYIGDEFRLVEAQDVRIRVQTREGSTDDPLIYLVDGDVARFIFKRDDTVSPATWKLIYQQDMGSARLPAGDFALAN